eukprot:6125966-Alexandrium_andersonii.AAC.1
MGPWAISKSCRSASEAVLRCCGAHRSKRPPAATRATPVSVVEPSTASRVRWWKSTAAGPRQVPPMLGPPRGRRQYQTISAA